MFIHSKGRCAGFVLFHDFNLNISSILRKMEDEENFKYLQIPIVELLATIAEHQPSLLEIFLDLEDKDNEDNSGEKKIGKQSCIPFVLDLIETRYNLTRSLVLDFILVMKIYHAAKWKARSGFYTRSGRAKKTRTSTSKFCGSSESGKTFGSRYSSLYIQTSTSLMLFCGK
jgi:hypothetical protein